MKRRIRGYNFWCVFRRAEDVPGEWTAHCLDLDVVTQGSSLRHAMQMLTEACFMVLVDDLRVGRDPSERRAPEEFYEDLYKIIQSGDRIADLADIDETKVQSMVCQSHLMIQMDVLGQESAATPETAHPEMPLVWTKPAQPGSCYC